MAARPPPLPAPLHPRLLLLDQPGRAVARRIAAALPGARRVLPARRAYDRARELDQDLERRRPALQVDQDRRPDHRPDLPLLLTDLRTGSLVLISLRDAMQRRKSHAYSPEPVIFRVSRWRHGGPFRASTCDDATPCPAGVGIFRSAGRRGRAYSRRQVRFHDPGDFSVATTEKSPGS